MSSSLIIGIDLGTTNTCAYVFHENEFKIIPTEDEKRILRSFVYYHSENAVFVGERGEKRVKNIQNGIYDIKRIIGRSYSEVQETQWPKLWPFQIEPSENDGCVILLEFNTNNEKKVVRKRPEEIYAEILKEVLKNARRFLNREVTEAVISVPAYFKTGQKNATITAAKIAGLKTVHLVQEPTAAALAFANNKNLENGLVLVYDFGGGTFDLALLEICGKNEYVVKSTSGLRNFGGSDIDNNLVNYFWKQIVVEFQKSGRNCEKKRERKIKKKLLTACRQVKVGLSLMQSDCIELESILDEDDVKINEELTREEFNKINNFTISKTIDLVEKFVTEHKCKNDITHVLLIGGSSRIPVVADKLEAFFDRKHLSRCVNPDEAVALGAAIEAREFMKRPQVDKKLEVADENLDGEKLKIVEVMPFSIGIATSKKEIHELIRKNTQIPVEVEEIYITNRNNQSEVDIELHEYESKKENNTFIGKLTITDILPKKKGKVRIRVKYIINESGSLEILATAIYENQRLESKLEIALTSFQMDKEEIALAQHNLRYIEDSYDDEDFLS